MIESALRGVWLGFSIAAPVGPIGMLVLKESLRRGRWAGVASGFGAAGVRMAAGFERPTAVAGGAVLLWLAWKSWREKPPGQAAADVATSESRWLNRTAATFLPTISNPMTILMFAALVASTGAEAPVWFVTGVFCGSMLWWILLSTAAGWLGSFVEIRGIWLSRVTAVTLAGFGAWEILAKGLQWR